ncbi:MAG: carbon storage regulator [Alphaproteobacteria bacterium]|nr:carbon storage regulator [Alphaproteobacteria bacterium]
MEYGRLCLGRGIGQSIIIGDGVEIKVNKIIGSYVQLTIIAPKSLRVHRREVWDRIKLEESDINE